MLWLEVASHTGAKVVNFLHSKGTGHDWNLHAVFGLREDGGVEPVILGGFFVAVSTSFSHIVWAFLHAVINFIKCIALAAILDARGVVVDHLVGESIVTFISKNSVADRVDVGKAVFGGSSISIGCDLGRLKMDNLPLRLVKLFIFVVHPVGELCWGFRVKYSDVHPNQLSRSRIH